MSSQSYTWLREATRNGKFTLAKRLTCCLMASVWRIVSTVEIAEPVAPKLCVESLATEAEHVSRRCAVVARQPERRFDAQSLDEIGRFTDKIFQRHPADEIGELFDGTRQFAAAQPFLARSPS